jgi:hypothetical protein
VLCLMCVLWYDIMCGAVFLIELSLFIFCLTLFTGNHRPLTYNGEEVYITSVEECGGVLEHTHSLGRELFEEELVAKDGFPEASPLDGNHRSSVDRKSYPTTHLFPTSAFLLACFCLSFPLYLFDDYLLLLFLHSRNLE